MTFDSDDDADDDDDVGDFCFWIDVHIALQTIPFLVNDVDSVS